MSNACIEDLLSSSFVTEKHRQPSAENEDVVEKTRTRIPGVRQCNETGPFMRK